jgi:predicted transcriptional regulator
MERQVTLTIPDELYQRAQRIAQSRRQKVADVLLGAIALDETADEYRGQTAVDREEAAWLQLHPWLREQYPGQYIAIYGGELVDRDDDQIALYERVRKRYPGKFVWIAQVKAAPIEEYVIRSPRLVKDF